MVTALGLQPTGRRHFKPKESRVIIEGDLKSFVSFVVKGFYP